jgi:hypothetical protein
MQLVGPYALDEAIWGFGFVYPPTAAYLLAPFTLGPPFWYAWNVASIFALVGIVLLMVRREAGHLSVRSGLVVGALAVVAFQVGITDLRTGHLSPMLAAAVGSMWLWPRWSAIPALVFGFIKIIPAMGLAWTIRQEGAWKAPLVIAGLFAGLVCVFHPGWFVLWLTALGNAQPACPSYALPSLACIGFPPALGYVAGLVLLLASWRAARADVSFLLLGLAMIAPLPDLYWGNLMVPMVAAIPLLMRLARQWATRLPGNAMPDQGIVEEQLAEPVSLKPPALVGTNLQS